MWANYVNLFTCWQPARYSWSQIWCFYLGQILHQSMLFSYLFITFIWGKCANMTSLTAFMIPSLLCFQLILTICANYVNLSICDNQQGIHSWSQICFSPRYRYITSVKCYIGLCYSAICLSPLFGGSMLTLRMRVLVLLSKKSTFVSQISEILTSISRIN